MRTLRLTDLVPLTALVGRATCEAGPGGDWEYVLWAGRVAWVAR